MLPIFSTSDYIYAKLIVSLDIFTFMHLADAFIHRGTTKTSVFLCHIYSYSPFKNIQLSFYFKFCNAVAASVVLIKNALFYCCDMKMKLNKNK